MGKTKREKLQKQHRSPLTCIFLDQETKRCGVYHARPDICRMFGLYEGLQCPNNTHITLRPDHEGRQRVRKNHTSQLKGILTTDITWEDFK